MATSRFKSKAGVYLYGKVRRTDFIPVHSKRDRDNYQQFRSDESGSDYDSAEEEVYVHDYDNYRTYGPNRDDDSDLSSGYGSDDSLSINSDDAERAYETMIGTAASTGGSIAAEHSEFPMP